MSDIDEKLCGFGIDSCEPADFEKFVQSFHAAITGTHFVPLGGVHDGGADGFEHTIHESGARANTFLQASKAQDVEKKIVQTVERLREFGRNPRVVIFYFSTSIPIVDKIEEDLSNKLDVTIKVRAKAYLVSHVNNSAQTVQAFRSFLLPSVQSVMGIGGTGRGRDFPFAAKTACAFIGQELNRRRGNASLLDTLTDSLILWSLEGTDPDQNKFMSEQDISHKIIEAVPAARQFITSNLKGKLQKLSSKSNPSGREISFHKKLGGYALRFDERKKLLTENAEEVRLFSSVGDEITTDIRAKLPERLHNLTPDILSAVRDSVETLFRKQGMDLGMFLVGADETGAEGIDLADDIDGLANAIAQRQADRPIVRDCIAYILRKLLYAPSEDQRDYMQRLSSTYFVLFALKNEPRVVEYFSSMAKGLVLYVGSDLIIKALSEYHLPESGRMITNTLKILQGAGSTLILTESTSEEVFTHIHAAILEFENNYAQIESSIGEDFISSIDRILIRSYFYARLGVNTGKAPISGWRSYIGQFCSYQEVRRKSGLDELQMYLIDRFSMEFESRASMEKSIDAAELENLKQTIMKERDRRKDREEILASNDAIQALRVFSKRSELKERHSANPYGYRTWWLTHERATERASAKITGNKFVKFVIKPEFLLNYITLLPSKAEVLRSYRHVFPTILGVSLGRRAPDSVLKAVLRAAKEVSEVDESRAKVMLSKFADSLKSDHMRIYDFKIDKFTT